MKHWKTILATALLCTLTACPGGSNPPPVINSFIATPSNLTLPGTIKLEWDVSGATALVIDGGVGAVTPTDKGNKSVSVSAGELPTPSIT